MTSEAEILVHITAPSTSKDDALYRTLATAYLLFEPGKKVDFPKDRAVESRAPPPAVLLSPQASFQSVWHNVGPPAARSHSQQSGLASAAPHGRDSQDSWVQPPSEVADSMPDNDISIEGFTTPTRIMKYFLQTAGPPSEPSQTPGQSVAAKAFATDHVPNNWPASTANTVLLQGNDNVSRITPAVEEARPFQYNDDVRQETPENIHIASDSRFDESHVSQTPSSPLRSRGVPLPHWRSSGDIQARSSDLSRTNQQSQSEVPGITIPATQLPKRAGSEPPSSSCSKRVKTAPLLRLQSHGLGRSSSDILPRGASRPSACLAAAPAAAAQVIDWSHETQLTSVEPPPASHKLGSSVPIKLELIMRDFGMDGRYKPAFQARKLREFERGYWLVDLHGWDHEGKVKAWGFLGNYIRRDNFAGWGTRACRDQDWTWIRLYGWEHLAGELYILLYVASYRRLKGMDITWYDGAGKELIMVAARSKRSR